MKPSILAGIAMIAIGAFLYLRGGSFTTREDVIKVGDLKVSAEEKHSILRRTPADPGDITDSADQTWFEYANAPR